MEFPVITATTAAALAVLQVVLMLRVGLARGKTNITLGDGGDMDMLTRIRIHGNLAENAALFLVMLTLVELSGQVTWAAVVMAVVFMAARIAHPLGMVKPAPNPLRAIGALGTVGPLVLGAGALGWVALTSLW